MNEIDYKRLEMFLVNVPFFIKNGQSTCYLSAEEIRVITGFLEIKFDSIKELYFEKGMEYAGLITLKLRSNLCDGVFRYQINVEKRFYSCWDETRNRWYGIEYF